MQHEPSDSCVAGRRKWKILSLAKSQGWRREQWAQKQIQLFAFTNPSLHPLKAGGEGDGLHLKMQRDIQEIPVNPFTGIGHIWADPTKPLPRNAVQVLWKGFKWGVPEVARLSGVRVDINFFSSDRAPTFNCRVEYLINGLHYNFDHLVPQWILT